jgi:probable HAF family extracellular repeat protein
MTAWRRLPPHICATALALSATTSLAAVPSFTPLGDLPGGETLSRAFDLSADGSVVVGLGSSANGTEAFRWSAATGIQGLGDLPGGGFQSVAQGVSPDGQFVVGYGTSASDFQAFRRGSDGVMVNLGDLPGGLVRSEANDASVGALVVVGHSSSANSGSDPSDFEAFRWTAQTGMVGLGDLPGGRFHSEALAVSDDGSVVVGAGRTLSDRGTPTSTAFRWTAATGMQPLARLPDSIGDHAALDVSADGSVVVGYGANDLGYRPLRWSGAGVQDLGQLNGLPTLATATNADGSVVAGRAYDSSDLFVWDQVSGMRSVKSILTAAGVLPAGWELDDITAMSADGLTLAGWGHNPSGATEAFVLTVPEPDTGLLLLSGFSLAGATRSRRRRRTTGADPNRGDSACSL